MVEQIQKKSQGQNRKWTKINVQNSKTEKSFEKDPRRRKLARKCSQTKKITQKMCYDNFLENNLEIFSFMEIWKH